MGDWEGLLHHLDCCELALGYEDFEARQERKMRCAERTRALLQLRRYDETIEACRDLEQIADEDEKSTITGVHAQVLYEKGEFDDALDLLRSANLDDSPRVWLYRSLSHASLGHEDEAMDCYREYEELVGVDVIGRSRLFKIMPYQPV